MKTIICKKCSKEFNAFCIIDGQRKSFYTRKYCLECLPTGPRYIKGVVLSTKNNKQCENCGKFFPYAISHEGRIRKFQSRKYCFECSPLDGRNNRNLTRTSKVCAFCMKDKPLIEFYKKGKGNTHYPYCLPCTILYNKQRRNKIKRQAVDYKGGKCCICGYNKSLSALDFHHRNPQEKDLNIAHCHGTFEKLKPELNKCDLVCCRCHREIHDGFHPQYLVQL